MSFDIILPGRAWVAEGKDRQCEEAAPNHAARFIYISNLRREEKT